MADAAPRRLAVSPYARRLARERGLPLDRLAGTGPDGRIIAADILAYVPPAATSAPAASAIVAPAVAAFAATIHLGAVEQLLAGFAAAGTPFAIEDIALRAAGVALADVSAEAGLAETGIALELGTRQLAFPNLARLSLSPIQQRRLAADSDDSSAPAALSLRIVGASAVRPVSMPLKPGRALRLVLTHAEGTAEALLSFDAAAVSEETAAALLTRFAALLETPLRLLA